MIQRYTMDTERMTNIMASKNIAQKILKISITLLTIFVIIQLSVGFLTRSQTVIADGISGLTGVITTFFSLAIIKFISKSDTKKYPFGKEGLEPFVGIVNYILMLFIVVIIILENIQLVMSGGNDSVYIIPVILFGFFSAIFNIFVYRYLKSLAKGNLTPITEAELVGWQFSVVIAIGVVIGFSFSWILSMTPLSAYTPYVDPILAIILMLVFATNPLFEIKNCLKELMQASPSEEIITTITNKIKKIDHDYDFVYRVLNVGKMGSKIRIEVNYLIKTDSMLSIIHEQDQLRNQIAEIFVELPYEKWVNINFTSDTKWIEHVL